MRYYKLVRDKIPEIIKQKGKSFKIHVADKSEYIHKLKEKLIEETDEFAKSGETEELADIIEVVYAIAATRKITKSKLESIRRKKSRERGAFKKKIILEETSD